jgi:hypothetical protein
VQRSSINGSDVRGDAPGAGTPPAPRRPAIAMRQAGRLDWAGWPLRAVILLILAATFAWYFRGDLMVDFARVWATCFNP